MTSQPVMAQPRMQPVASMQPSPMPAQPQPMPQQSGEATVGVIVFRKMKSLGRYDSYAGVVTTERMIFAQLTADMLNQAAQQARDQAKAEGKGFFGQWGRPTTRHIWLHKQVPHYAASGNPGRNHRELGTLQQLN